MWCVWGARYLRLSDCSQVSDGGAALVLASEDGLAKIGKTPADCVEVLGLGCAASSLFTTPDPLALPTCAAAGVSAFTQVGNTSMPHAQRQTQRLLSAHQTDGRACGERERERARARWLCGEVAAVSEAFQLWVAGSML